jgi:hypothetical protein
VATTIHLYKHAFSELERVLLETTDFKVSTFIYPSGVCAVRLENSKGHLIMLPFQGQQIWDAVLHGRRLTMHSMFIEPKPTHAYLENYGGLLLHCGVTAMGVPAPTDTHPLHGELPNAPYQTAFLQLSEDEHGEYIALGGSYQHTVAFAHNYVARPEVRFYANSSRVGVQLKIENLKASPMDLMYLAHLNLRPKDEAEIMYSAKVTPQTVRIRSSIPAHAKFSHQALAQLEQLKQNPELHHVLKTGVSYDPEVVFFIDYLADSNGWAHSLQVHPDGSADHVMHRPSQLPIGVRWITRTPDQDGFGLVLPATAEPTGYETEKASGRVLTVAPKATWSCEYAFDVIAPSAVADVKTLIASIVQV